MNRDNLCTTKKAQIMTDKNDEIRHFLENIPEAFQIMEAGIDLQTQKEYFEYSDSFDRGQLSEEKTLHLGSILRRVNSLSFLN